MPQHDANAEAEYQLVSGMAAGNRACLEKLYELYLPTLSRFFTDLTLTGESAIIDHLIYLTMHHVWRASTTLTSGRSVYVWIMQMAFGQTRQTLELLAPDRRDRTARSARRERVGRPCRIVELLSQLSFEERAVVHLVYGGRSCEQVEAILGMTRECVGTLLSHSRCVLRRFQMSANAREAQPAG